MTVDYGGFVFSAGDILRLRDDPARAGVFTGKTRDKGNRPYCEVRMADGSGTRFLPMDRLVGEAVEVDSLADLKAGRFASPEIFRRTLLHHRLTGRLRDIIYSMDVSDTEFHAYQFKPVVKAVSSPSRGLLIADEVGLGKTIEAGLVWTELVARFDCSRLLVVCPKSLTEKWKLELWQKFSVDAKIVTAEQLHDHLKMGEDGGDGFALIVSLSSVRPPKGWDEEGESDSSARGRLARYLRGAESREPLIDCVIFDEAHHLRNPTTMSHAFAQLAVAASEFKLLLSATPINLHTDELRSLLSLIDPETFDRPESFRELNEENKPLVHARETARNMAVPLAELRRMLNDMPEGEVLQVGRQLKNLVRELSGNPADTRELRVRIASQIEEMSLLGTVVNRTRRRDVNDFQVKRSVQDLRWELGDAERLFYDRASDVVRQHAFELDANELFLLATPQRLLASSLPAAFRHWRIHEQDDEILEDGSNDEETRKTSRVGPGPLTGKLSKICTDATFLELLEREDSKFARLLDGLRQLREQGDEKIVVFSSFRTTLDYLSRRLKAEGQAIEIMHGAIKESRTDIITRFAETAGPCILLTSEVGGEGLDMQFCRALINYDLPWNPMKVEQRIGRLDRLGQKAERISVISLIAHKTIEERIYDRLYRRLMEIEETLGAFEAILGSEISELERKLLDPSLSDDEKEEEIKRSALALETRQQQMLQLEEEAPGLIAHGDMILEHIEASHRPERRIAAGELADYVNQAISNAYPGSFVEEVRDEPGIYQVRLSEAAHLALRNAMGRGGRARTRLSSSREVKASFERKPGMPKSYDFVSTVHPLVNLATSLREEEARGVIVKPVIACQMPACEVNLSEGLYLAAVQRWSVKGAIKIDRIAYAACPLDDGQVLEANEAEVLVQGALRNGRPVSFTGNREAAAERFEALLDRMNGEFENFVDAEESSHFDRAETNLRKLDRQARKRGRDLRERLDSWKMSGDAKKLKMVAPEQARFDKFMARIEEKRTILEKLQGDFQFSEAEVGLAIIALV